MAEIVDNLDVAIEPFFTKEELNQLAEESGFIQRQRKLHGHAFLDLIVFYSDNLKTQSLNDLALILEEKHQIIIQTQSLNERFNNNALVFLKDALEKMLKKQLDIEHVLSDIKGIHSTCTFKFVHNKRWRRSNTSRECLEALQVEMANRVGI